MSKQSLKVPNTALLTISVTSEEHETRYSQTGFKMPPEIQDGINCSFTSISSEQTSHISKGHVVSNSFQVSR